jgi:hypothetical protein
MDWIILIGLDYINWIRMTSVSNGIRLLMLI